MFFFLLGFVASFTIQIKQNYNCIDWIIMDTYYVYLFFLGKKNVFTWEMGFVFCFACINLYIPLLNLYIPCFPDNKT